MLHNLFVYFKFSHFFMITKHLIFISLCPFVYQFFPSLFLSFFLVIISISFATIGLYRVSFSFLFCLLNAKLLCTSYHCIITGFLNFKIKLLPYLVKKCCKSIFKSLIINLNVGLRMKVIKC